MKCCLEPSFPGVCCEVLIGEGGGREIIADGVHMYPHCISFGQPKKMAVKKQIKRQNA